MLFINKKYESLDQILKKGTDEKVSNENISDKGFADFKKSLNDSPVAELLNDSEIDNYSNAVTKYAHRQVINEYDEFFESHGIAEYKERIINLFLKNDKADELKKIIEGDGLITEAMITSNDDLAKLCKGYEDEAGVIAKWQGIANGKSVGPYEILLRMVLVDGNAPAVGDVGLGNKVIEVKGTGGGAKRDTYAHPSFQGISKDNIVYKAVDDEFNSLNSSVDGGSAAPLVENPGDINYAQSKSINLFNDLLRTYIDLGGDASNIAAAFVDGVSAQYSRHMLGDNSKLTVIANEYLSLLKSCSMKPTDLRSMIGRMQVCAYCSRYDYMMIINGRNMHYLLLDEASCVKKSKEITYGTIDMTPSGRPGTNIRYDG